MSYLIPKENKTTIILVMQLLIMVALAEEDLVILIFPVIFQIFLKISLVMVLAEEEEVGDQIIEVQILGMIFQ
jgi:phosphatidylinositol kinase/protein kinase (PI-3  family)